MKKAVIFLFIAIGLSAGAQNFEKKFPFWNEAYGDVVFSYDDGYAIVGLGSQEIYNNYLYIIRTNLYGDTLWTKQLDVGNNGSYPGYINASAIDKAGNIYLAPILADSAHLIKFSPDWEILWIRTFEPRIAISQITVSKDNHLLVTGNNALHEQRLYKMDLNGDIIWQSVPINTGYQFTFAYSPAIVELENENIALVSCLINMFGTITSSNICHFTKDGDTISSTTIGLVLGSTYAIDNEFLSIANKGGYDSNENSLIRYLPDGTILWNKPLELPFLTACFDKFIYNQDSNLVVIGYASPTYIIQQLAIHCMTPDGDSLWTRTFGNTDETIPMDIKLSSDGGYIVSGYADFSGQNVPYLVKTDAGGNISSLGIPESDNKNIVNVHPNPSTDFVVFSIAESTIGLPLKANNRFITITDISGRPVASVPVNGAKTVWDARGIIPGIYFYSMEIKGLMINGKIMIIR